MFNFLKYGLQLVGLVILAVNYIVFIHSIKLLEDTALLLKDAGVHTCHELYFIKCLCWLGVVMWYSWKGR
jgi:hypothetical protein